MHLLPSTRKRANLFGLPPGGMVSKPQAARTEGACGIIAYHSPQKKYSSFVHAGSSHRYRGPPSSRRRALPKRHPSLTLSSPSTHRHSLLSTTRLSRGFRFIIKNRGTRSLAVPRYVRFMQAWFSCFLFLPQAVCRLHQIAFFQARCSGCKGILQSRRGSYI